jgi:hypothetical protein
MEFFYALIILARDFIFEALNFIMVNNNYLIMKETLIKSEDS